MAVQPSNAARRVAEVLTALADTGGHDLSLTELADRTAMNKTTCQATLLALAQTGFVRRDEGRKTYRLGAAVLALGAADGPHQHALAVARRTLRDLADDLDVETVATVTADRSIVKVARVMRPGIDGLSLPVGRSVPFSHPFGHAHVAWSAASHVRDWMTRGGAPPDSDLGRRAAAGLSAVRERGFSVTLDASARHRMVAAADADAELVAELARHDHQLVTIDAGTRYAVSQITAPVFDESGRVVLVLGLMEVGERTGTVIERHAATLVASATSITRTIGGRTPEP